MYVVRLGRRYYHAILINCFYKKGKTRLIFAKFFLPYSKFLSSRIMKLHDCTNILTQSFIAPTNAKQIHIKTLKLFTLKYITIAPTCFGFFSVLIYTCCALVGAIKDSVSQNGRCNSENVHKFILL
jgi:hypothetical protein